MLSFVEQLHFTLIIQSFRVSIHLGTSCTAQYSTVLLLKLGSNVHNEVGSQPVLPKLKIDIIQLHAKDYVSLASAKERCSSLLINLVHQ